MVFKQLKHFLILLALVLVAGSLRWYQIDTAPKGALIDEAHFGYLAYSLLETGKDEHGVSYPIIFKGFGDNKLPAGAYLLMPVVKLFGLSNATIRIPSVIVGTLLVLAMYWLAREFHLKKQYAYLAAAITALSPWTFFLSRFGFESNLGLFFFTLGLAALLRASNALTKTKTSLTPVYGWLFFASTQMAATWYSYISFRPITVVLMVGFWLAVAWQQRAKVLIPAVFSIATLLLLVLPLLIGPAAAANGTRLKQVGIFTDPSTALIVNENRTFCTMQWPKTWCYLMWNKATIMAPVLAGRFFEVYSPQYLATQGEALNVFLTISGFGEFYLAFFPMLLLGMVWIVVSRLPAFKSQASVLPSFTLPQWSLLISGFLAAPIPTILVGPAQPVRLSPLIPFLIIAIVVGLASIHHFLKHFWLKIAFWLILASIAAFQSASFFTNYFVIHMSKNDFYYQSYLPQMYAFLETLNPTTQVYIKPYFSDPLMFYAYYTKMDPRIYQRLAVLGELEPSGFQHTVELGRIKTTSNAIGTISCKESAAGNNAVFVTNEVLPYPILYAGKSASGVHNYVYVYDATDAIMVKNCSK